LTLMRKSNSSMTKKFFLKMTSKCFVKELKKFYQRNQMSLLSELL